MQTFGLHAHPATPPVEVRGISVAITHQRYGARVEYTIRGAGQVIASPPAADPARRDRLWTATCCEIFMKLPGSKAYTEFNFGPSGDWAAYRFGDLRASMAWLDPAPRPDIRVQRNEDTIVLSARMQAADLLSRDTAIGLAAVIEEEGGVLSYWALAHAGDRPDFHDPACFTARLAAPARR